MVVKNDNGRVGSYDRDYSMYVADCREFGSLVPFFVVIFVDMISGCRIEHFRHDNQGVVDELPFE